MLELISLAISDNDISSVLEALAVLNLVQPEQIFAKSEQFRKSYLLFRKMVEVSVSLIKHRDYKSVSIALGAKVPARQIIRITFAQLTFSLTLLCCGTPRPHLKTVRVGAAGLTNGNISL